MMRCLLDEGAKEDALEAYEKEAEASRQEIRQLKHDLGMGVDLIAMLTDNYEVLQSQYDAIALMLEQNLLDTDDIAAIQEESKILKNIEVLDLSLEIADASVSFMVSAPACTVHAF